MSTNSDPAVPRENPGIRRIAIGAGLGLAGGLVGIVFPIALIVLGTLEPGGLAKLGSSTLEATTILVLAGALLFVLSLALYRWGFSALRKVDRTFTTASILCLVGSLGFLLILLAATLLVGSSNALVACAQVPQQGLKCLDNVSPLGAYSATIGFWMAWIGGVGLVLGLGHTGGRYHRAPIYGGSFLYGLLLLVVVGPFLGLVYAVPHVEYLLLAIPLLALLAPGFTLWGALPAARSSVRG
ncbi:MAG: hypothetical protein L3K03_04550 [Thermoplasmata archaeon]|nr:hypothetical protein [Thermoplasmata archaeon]